MFDWLSWFTQMENTKPFVLVLYFSCFVGIMAYLFIGRKRTQRFEKYKHIPFDDED